MYRVSVRAACGRRLRKRKMSQWERKPGTSEHLANHHKGLRHFLEKALEKFAKAESAHLDAVVEHARAQSDESGKALDAARNLRDAQQVNLDWQRKKTQNLRSTRF